MTATEKAKKLIESRSTKDLVTDFEFTDLVEDENISIVRGWIMDELQSRNPDAFDKWIDSFDESPRKYFCNNK